MLDTVFDPDRGVLWVIDILAWRDVPLSEGQADFRYATIRAGQANQPNEGFRLFWNQSRLADLPCQPYQPPSELAQPLRQLLVLPVPSLNAPMPRSALVDRITKCQSLVESIQCLVTSKSIDASMETHHPSDEKTLAKIEYEPDGLLFVVASAVYESGLSCLAAWVSAHSPTLSNLQQLT